MIPGYCKIHNLGHKEAQGIENQCLFLEEKIDGSQFSFSLGLDGVLRFRSKSKEQHPEHPDDLFTTAVREITGLRVKLRPGYVYRGEYLAKPKHNTLVYDRVPKHHVILFDIISPEGRFLQPTEKAQAAQELDLEVVPLFFQLPPKALTVSLLDQLLAERVSCLGKARIEGVVIKPCGYDFQGPHGLVMAKYVSPAFKEANRKTGAKVKRAQTGADIIDQLIEIYRTEARWRKAVQHLLEEGKAVDCMQAIPDLMREVVVDTEAECQDEIKQALWDWAWPILKRRINTGLPEWFKAQLAETILGNKEPHE